jgi:DNA polymerase zeta
MMIIAEDLRVQVVYVDHYFSKPMPPCSLPGLNQSTAYKLADEVPVIRIFGSTPPGQKTLVHIHGVGESL